jgi:transcriptional regulator with XRE-family HTH domain
MRIKELIEASGMTNKQVYEGVGISKIALMNIVRGESFPRADTLEKIAKFLGVPCGALFDDWQEEKRSPDFVCPHCGKPISIEIK